MYVCLILIEGRVESVARCRANFRASVGGSWSWVRTIRQYQGNKHTWLNSIVFRFLTWIMIL